jgi:D-alanine-D-alanine ligase-like ATP-grasp enzyme
MRDFARFDGWILDTGEIWFSDFNPISGMEQNSFLFQQASRIGFSHRDVFMYILKSACRRYGIDFPDIPQTSSEKKKAVSVLFGGATSERQVSLMSGTNVWLKLRKSKKYSPQPFLLDLEGNVWKLPYLYNLNHTVEEIIDNCEKAIESKNRLSYLEEKVTLRLALQEGEATEKNYLPEKFSFTDFVNKSEFIFLALHGGFGENGDFQKVLESKKVLFNGSNHTVSRLCMDKYETNKFIENLKISGISTTLGQAFKLSELKNLSTQDSKKLWQDLRSQLSAKTIIVKPRADGCSSGIAHLYSEKDLEKYISLVNKKAAFIPKNTFPHQDAIIEMPTACEDFIFEKFFETDSIKVKGNKLKHTKKTGLVEVTVGVLSLDSPSINSGSLGTRSKRLRAFNPSITISEGEVLSVEEKFQGGTGINITPPPEEIVKKKALERTKKLIEILAEKVGITGYARIDAFMNIYTGNIFVIEINTLPGLTASTVLYHQALAEKEMIQPVELLEKIIENGGY